MHGETIKFGVPGCYSKNFHVRHSDNMEHYPPYESEGNVPTVLHVELLQKAAV